jgi:ElaB/YqjD/DUF883 family membrane-anchored ribosome-binding protein
MTTFANQGNANQGNKGDKGALREDVSEMKRDAGAMKEDLHALKRDATQIATHATHEAMDAVRCGAKQMQDAARSAGDTAAEYHERFRERVSMHPTTSVLIALGAGVVVGRLLGRR